MANNATKSWGWIAAAIGTFMLLIALGVLPRSCGKALPFVGRHYKDYCGECGGDGKVDASCRSCFGRGYYSGARCAACNGAGKVEQTCPYCAGSGKKPSK